jgi:hypothetical protein
MKTLLKMSLLSVFLFAVVSSADAQFDPYGKDQVKTTKHKAYNSKVNSKRGEGYTKAKVESHTAKSWKGHKKARPVAKHKKTTVKQKRSTSVAK